MNKAHIEFLLQFLQCPISGGDLVLDSNLGMLFSKEAQVYFPIKDGIPLLIAEEAISKEDIGKK